MTIFFTKMCACGADYVLLDGYACAPERPGEIAKALLGRHGACAAALVLLRRCGGGCRVQAFAPDGRELPVPRGALACAARVVLGRGPSCPARLLTECRGRTAVCCGMRLVRLAGLARAAFCGRAELCGGRDERYGRW